MRRPPESDTRRGDDQGDPCRGRRPLCLPGNSGLDLSDRGSAASRELPSPGPLAQLAQLKRVLAVRVNARSCEAAEATALVDQVAGKAWDATGGISPIPALELR